MPAAAAHDVRAFSWSRAAQIAAAAFFLAAITLPLLDSIFHFAPEAALHENRRLKAYPQLRWKRGSHWKRNLWRELKKYPPRFEAAFSDRFGFRSSLVRLNNAIKVFALHTSPTPRVVIGKKGWLYYGPGLNSDAPAAPAAAAGSAASAGKSASAPAGIPAGEAATRWREEIAAKSAWCRARGIAYLFVLVPVKETIYPEFVPEGMLPAKPTRADTLIAELRAANIPEALDLRPVLLEARRTSGTPLFYRTDTHWNDSGAFVGVNEVLARLNKSLPDLRPLDSRALAWKRETVRDMNLAMMLGFGNRISESVLVADTAARTTAVADAPWFGAFKWGPDLAPKAWECRAAGNQRRVALCSDSFGRALAPLLANAAGRTDFARFPFPCTAAFHAFQEKLIADERPDALVELVSEQHLVTPPLVVFGTAENEARPAEPPGRGEP